MNAQIVNRAHAKKDTLPANVVMGIGSSQRSSATLSVGDRLPQSQESELIDPSPHSALVLPLSPKPLTIEIASEDTSSTARTLVYVSRSRSQSTNRALESLIEEPREALKEKASKGKEADEGPSESTKRKRKHSKRSHSSRSCKRSSPFLLKGRPKLLLRKQKRMTISIWSTSSLAGGERLKRSCDLPLSYLLKWRVLEEAYGHHLSLKSTYWRREKIASDRLLVEAQEKLSSAEISRTTIEEKIKGLME
ncbi:UNVERIFIED_CONTAM: hypothetical protein Sradi_5843200 [Sesamum radiatum]|uniref:Uncharacterized protein n=1 Tax=Sesamum radiatum TaxID=300843 RepID=A0AAW2KRS9_SESRA